MFVYFSLDDRVPFNVVADWSFGGGLLSIWPNLPISSNELTWMRAPAYIESPIPVAKSPIFIYDLPPRASSVSISSEDGCSSPEAIQTPRIGGFHIIERNPDNKWRFPKTDPPPVPLPGWFKLP